MLTPEQARAVWQQAFLADKPLEVVLDTHDEAYRTRHALYNARKAMRRETAKALDIHYANAYTEYDNYTVTIQPLGTKSVVRITEKVEAPTELEFKET